MPYVEGVHIVLEAVFVLLAVLDDVFLKHRVVIFRINYEYRLVYWESAEGFHLKNYY